MALRVWGILDKLKENDYDNPEARLRREARGFAYLPGGGRRRRGCRRSLSSPTTVCFRVASTRRMEQSVLLVCYRR